MFFLTLIVLVALFFVYSKIGKKNQEGLDAQFIEESLQERKQIDFLVSLRDKQPDNHDLIEHYINILLEIRTQRESVFFKNNPNTTISLQEKMELQNYIVSRIKRLKTIEAKDLVKDDRYSNNL